MRMDITKIGVARSTLRFSCELCGEEYSYKSKLRLHIESDHLGATFQLQIRDENFSSENKSKKRRLSVRSESKFYCEPCGKFFCSSSKLLRHNNTVHTSIKYACQVCDKTYSRKDDLKAHASAFHLGMRFSCVLCGKKFVQNYKLKEHVNSQHTGSYLQRESNSESIQPNERTKPNNAMRSQPSHSRITVVCQLCGKNFKSEKYLRAHHRSKHHLELQFECQLCGANFSKSDTLVKHTQSAHILELTFTCEFCKEEFCQKEMLKVHEMSCFSGNSDAGSVNGLKVTDFGWCNCEFCLSRMSEPRKFNICLMKLNIVTADERVPNVIENVDFNESVLSLEVNSDETDGCCKIKTTANGSSDLENYLIFAEPNSNDNSPNCKEKNEGGSQIRRFSCAKCDKKYTEKKSLRRHELRVHISNSTDNATQNGQNYEKENSKKSNENLIRIFPCSKCEKRYTEKKSLRRHELRAHLGVKFQCALCDNVYLYQSQLRRHTQNKHLGVRFACQFCGKLFARKDHLKFHAKTVHQQIVR